MTNIKEKFTKIYETDQWKGGSGPGSKIEFVKDYIHILKDLLETYKIKSCIDYGCGDWQFSKTIKWNKLVDSYIGTDIVDHLIKDHKKYENDVVKFLYLDEFKFRQCDLIICKDVLQHLPNNMVHGLLNQMLKNSKYLLLTNDYYSLKSKHRNLINSDCPEGGWRPINFFDHPWNLNGKVVWDQKGKLYKHSIFLVSKNQNL